MQKKRKNSSKKNTSGQMKLSFGMIFSIILIILFLIFAFYAIMKILEVQKKSQIGLFVKNLESDIENTWKSQQTSREISYRLPKKVQYVCFVDYSSRERGINSEFYRKLKQVYNEFENLFFYPVGSGYGLDSVKISYIDLDKITQKENPFCIENTEGVVKLRIKKSYGESLVGVER